MQGRARYDGRSQTRTRVLALETWKSSSFYCCEEWRLRSTSASSSATARRDKSFCGGSTQRCHELGYGSQVGSFLASPRPTKPSSREPLTMRFSIVYTTVVLKGVHFPPPPGQPRCYLSYLDGLRGRVLVGGARAHATTESARSALVLACKSTYSFIFGEPVADITRGSDVCGRVLRCEGGPGATATTDSAWPRG